VDELAPRQDEYVITKRRYSCFFGTDLEILLKGLKVDTLILLGGLTDVCVHYTFVDAHQHDYYTRVIEDCCGGSTHTRHEAALDAMEYLQSGARRSAIEIMAAFAALGTNARVAI
jgi:nicotinamidase-related amidase